MKGLIIKARDIFSQGKIWLLRSTSYMGIGNSILMILIFFKIEDNPTLTKFIIPLIVGWITLLIIIGYIEAEVFKGPQTETRKMLHLNQPMEFIYNKSKDTNERVKIIELKMEELLNERNV